jgi:hypothetical protein
MNRRNKTERAIVKKIGLIAAILAIILMALAAAYQLASHQQHLADDLTGAFSNNKK